MATELIVEPPLVLHALRGELSDTASEMQKRKETFSGPSAISRVLSAASLPNFSPSLSTTARYLVIALALLANFAQFITNCFTIGAGVKLSALLGRDVGPGQANWMPAAYPLTQSAFVLISGRLGAIYGHQLLVVIGTASLVVFSIANGFCTSYESFVAVRALTGIGGGLVMPNAVAVTTTLLPPGRSRNVVLGCFGATAPVGGWLGVLLAGAFIEHNRWQWMFYFMAILAGFLLLGLLAFYQKEVPVDRAGRVDYLGAVLGFGALILFNFAWNQAPSAGWSSPSSLVPLCISVPMFLSFTLWEAKYAKEPIMPLSLFTTPTFSALVAVVLLSYMSFGISLWYMVAWLQIVRGWSIIDVAVGWLPFVIGSTLAVYLAAWMIPRVQAQWIMAVGVVTAMCANLILATMPAQQTYWAQAFPAITLTGVCPDFVYVAAQLIASNSVGRRHQGVAGSLIGTLNLYGNSLGLGFSSTIETQVTKNANGNELRGYSAALYFGAALALLGVALDLAFVRVPKDEREGWQSEEDIEESRTPTGQASGIDLSKV